MSESRVAAITHDLLEAFQRIVEKHNITQAEYRAAVEFIDEAVTKGETFLLPDAFLESTVVANASKQQQGTPGQVLGPYYVPDSPWIEDDRLAREEEPGERLTIRGEVRDTDGRPLADAVLDVWQADAKGRYSSFDPSAPKGNLRGRLRTGRDGSYAFETVVPAQYTIPHQGPTGRLLKEIGRHPWRPAHVHVIATHDGYRPLTTQIYFQGDEYLDSDSVRAARPDLAFALHPADGAKSLAFDIVLEPA